MSETARPQVRVFRYAFRPASLDVPPEAEAQFLMAAELWNRLVALEREHGGRVDAVYRADPELGRQIDEEERLTERIDGLHQALRRCRRRGDETQAADLSARLGEALSLRSDLWQRQRAMRRARLDSLRPALRAIDADQGAAVKRARQEATGAGLGWGTCNDVISRFGRARKRSRSHHGTLGFVRREDRPAGSIVVQLQHNAALRERPATMERLFSGRHAWAGFFRIDPVELPPDWDRLPRSARRAAQRTRVQVRVSERRTASRREVVYLSGEIVMHRPLPPGAVVKSVRVRREATSGRVGPGRFAYSLHLACEVPAPAPRAVGPTVAIDFRPRRLPDQSVRAAVWRSDEGRGGEVRLPPDLVAAFDQQRALASALARSEIRLRRRLARWLDAHPDADPYAQAAVRAALDARTRRALGGAALALQPVNGDLATIVTTWRTRHRRLVLWRFHLRSKAIRRRNDLYRNVAYALAGDHAVVLVSDAGPGKRPVRRGRGDADALRDLRQIAAPATLRTMVQEAATKVGASHAEMVLSAPSHHDCGAELQPSFGAGQPAVVVCPHCSVAFDRDVNRCERMLAVAQDEATVS